MVRRSVPSRRGAPFALDALNLGAGERTRLACGRWRLAIANFSGCLFQRDAETNTRDACTPQSSCSTPPLPLTGCLPGGTVTIMAYEFPKLPYPYDPLQPHIHARTMGIHHTKHPQTYITNSNNALNDQP